MRSFLSRIGLVWLFFVGQAIAATTPNSTVSPQTPKWAHVQITNANNLTAQTLYTCGTNGSKVTAIYATSTDGSLAHDTQILNLNTSTYTLTTVSVPVNAGNIAATPPVNMMSAAAMPGLPRDSDGNPFFYCASGDVLQAAVLVQITTAKFVNVYAVVADF